jgi:hypothetical protein
MKKLTMNLDTLRVQSFPTEDPAPDVRGTVQGAGAVAPPPSWWDRTPCMCTVLPTRQDDGGLGVIC